MVETFIKEFTKAAHEKGIRQLEFYTERIEKVSADVHKGQIESGKKSDTAACYVEGCYEGNRGAIYVENFSKEYFPEEIQMLMEVARYAGEAFEGKDLTAGEETCGQASEKRYALTKESRLEETLLQVEKETLAANPGLHKLNHFGCEEVIRTITIQNDKGDRLKDCMKHAQFYIGAEARADGVVQIASGSAVAGQIEEIHFADTSCETAKEACDLLDAKPVPTGKYAVILKNSVITEMLSMYLASFGAANVHKKLSKLADRKGQQIAAKRVCLIEDPALPEGIGCRAFDDEGVKTTAKEIIKDGILQTFLYNREEAKKDHSPSTGNGFKESYKSSVGIGVTNVKLLGEDLSRTELIQKMGDGLYITACDGMFAGADPVSGDFSLISKGYLVKGGVAVRGVNQIAVAGNFFTLLMDVQGISNDYLVEAGNLGTIIAPSVWVKELVVSGE